MNRIGFSMDGEIGRPEEFRRHLRSDASYSEHGHHGDMMAQGYAGGGNVRKLDRETAEEWVSSMKNEDGSVGAHWPLEKTRQLQTQKNVMADPVHFWVAMNMMYSDYCDVLIKAGANTDEVYADLAKAFLMDKDAHRDKLERYWNWVVKH